ncbi:hypothetical protein IPG36_00865 [bacterium]|nr:MAG: hypothetical protein IPG36_00865 [bacterium]
MKPNISLMQMPVLNLTTIIAAALLAGSVYGVFAGQQRLRLLILSSYVGIVISTQLSSQIAPNITFLTPEQLGWVSLGAPIVLFGFFGVHHANGHSRGAMIANLLIGTLAAALIAATTIALLPASQADMVANDSILALYLRQGYPWLLGLLPVTVWLLGFARDGKH